VVLEMPQTKERHREYMREKRLMEKIDARLNEQSKPEPDLIQSIAEANSENPLGFEPEEIKEFGKEIGKPLKQSFFEDKPNQTTNLNCLEMQRHIKDYIETGNREHFIDIANHCSNCNPCALYLADMRRGYGGFNPF
jgi:hypothetical protein